MIKLTRGFKLGRAQIRKKSHPRQDGTNFGDGLRWLAGVEVLEVVWLLRKVTFGVTAKASKQSL